MSYTQEELDEFLKVQPGASWASEGGRDYFLLPNLALPPGCEPSIVNALLCVSEESGYKCRLFFSQQISTPAPKNWNSNNVRILGRNWFAYSYQTPDNLSLLKKFIVQYDGITAEKKS